MEWVTGISADGVGGAVLGGYSRQTWDDPIEPFLGRAHVSLARFDGDGTLLWNTFFYSSVSLRPLWGGNGTVLVAGTSYATWGDPIHPYTNGGEAYLARFDGNGQRLWNTFMGGGYSLRGGDDDTGGMARDADGNLYVIGTSYQNWGDPRALHQGERDAFVAKFDPLGNLLWNTFLGGTGDDWGISVEAAADGTLWAVGTSGTTWGTPAHPKGEGTGLFIARLDTNGNLLWNTFYGGNGSQRIGGTALDGQGNLFVGGSHSSLADGSSNGERNTVGFLAKLSPQGVPLWEARFDQAPNSFIRGVALDGANQPVVIGFDNYGYYSLQSAFVAKLGESGSLRWRTSIEGSVASLSSDDQEGIFVRGSSYSSWGNPVRPWSGDEDAYVAAFDGDGRLRWNTFLGAGGRYNSRDVGTGLAWMGDAGLLVSGASKQQPLNPDAPLFLARLEPSTGELRWNLFLDAWLAQTAIVSGDDGWAYLYGASGWTWGDPIVPFHGGPWDDGALAAIPPIRGVTPHVLTPGGTITPDTVQWRIEGERIQFALLPGPGYAIESVAGCPGELYGLTFVAQPGSGDCDLDVSFVKNPLAPTIQSLFDGDRSATVLFTPNDGGAASYTARCTPADGGDPVTATGAGSPLVITGLTNGVAYTCTIQVTGSSQLSASFNLAPSATATGRPTPVPALGSLPLLWLAILIGLAAGVAARRSIRR